MPDEGLDPVDDAPQVDGQAPVPIVDRVVPDMAFGPRADAGVVAQHMNGAVGGVRLVAQLLDRAKSVTSVTTPVTSWPALLNSSTACERIGEHIGQHGAHAGHGGRPPSALPMPPRPGDYRGAALEVLHATWADAKAGQRIISAGMSPGPRVRRLRQGEGRTRRRAAPGPRGEAVHVRSVDADHGTQFILGYAREGDRRWRRVRPAAFG